VSWSEGQLRILRELGHEPMRLASASAPPANAPASGPAPAGAAGPPPAPAAPAQLAAALARAAGGRDLSELALDLDRLRREPALKRALWPRLRALRRGH
jgi:pyruvate/2-oxoglutarate dehydrogenase complex dihydrolipoamide acyltransferase (E2) component